MTDIEVYEPPAAPEQYRAALAMTPEAAKALDDQLRACTRAVLREGTDYGVIPGTGGDKTLLKPGAEKLLQWFGFAYTMNCLDIERDDENRKQGATYRCTITKRIGDPQHGLLVEVATCEGYAGYDEAKFFQTAEEAQFKAEANERNWAARDKRVANPNRWKHLTGYRAPWNTIIKMAQKRALVGATLDATAAAGLFSQEEDHAPVADDGSTWYEQALETALTFTATADGQQLIVDAAHAARDGLCTPGQATHIKNRVRQRLQLLQNAVPVDVEDLGRQAAKSPGPGESGSSDGHAPSAPEPPTSVSSPGPAVEMPENEPGSASKGQLTRLHTILSGLGSEDREERLRIAETLTGHKPLTGPHRGRTSSNLSWTEAAGLIEALAGFDGDHDNLLAWISEREQAAEPA